MKDEEAARKIRIAYMLGWQFQYFQLDFDQKYGGGEPSEKGRGFGDYMMFLYTPEEHAYMLNVPEEEDVLEVGKITAEDITFLLKIIYGENYEEMKAVGDENRKEFEQEKAAEKKKTTLKGHMYA
jgi:hypothetical protein